MSLDRSLPVTDQRPVPDVQAAERYRYGSRQYEQEDDAHMLPMMHLCEPGRVWLRVMCNKGLNRYRNVMHYYQEFRFFSSYTGWIS